MKHKSRLFLLSLVTLATFACSGEKEEETNPSTPLSEQVLEFEIYDSLVVDYLGNVSLVDISPDGKTFLLQDANPETFLISSSSGELIDQFKLRGEGPNEYNENPLAKSKFINNQEFMIPTTGGMYLYNLEGKLQKQYKLDFTCLPQLLVPNSGNLIVGENQIFIPIPGRGSDEFGTQGIDYQEKSKHVEILDLSTGTYSPAITFPSTSKFTSTDKAYPSLSFFTNLAMKGDSLYLSFRNEPKIYTYAISDLGKLVSTKSIPFPSFREDEPKDDQISDSFELKDIFVGTLNYIIPTEKDDFLINYKAGVTVEQFDAGMANIGGEINKLWEEIEKVNDGGLVLFNGKEISSSILQPEILGNLNHYVSKDEIWFSLNFSEAENDYSVIYKTRLVTK